MFDISPRNIVAAKIKILWCDGGAIDPEAMTVAVQLRSTNFGNKPISGDRLPLEVLDTLGTIYRAAGQFDLVAKVYNEAASRYGKE